MDNCLIFSTVDRCEAGTQEDSQAAGMEIRGQIVRVECSEVRTPLGLGDDAELIGTKLMNSHWREKLLSITYRRPYRKPTQVGGKRIARRAR